MSLVADDPGSLHPSPIPHGGDESSARRRAIGLVSAINRFLERVFGEATRLSDLLLRAGLSPRDVEALRTCHLDAVIDAVRVGLTTYLDEILPPKHALVVSQRYCLSGTDPPTLRELADDLGLSRERVRQLETAGVTRLRGPTRRAAIESIVLRCALEVLASANDGGESVRPHRVDGPR